MCEMQETEYYGYFPSMYELLKFIFEQQNEEIKD